jgi:hypothetical protein
VLWRPTRVKELVVLFFLILIFFSFAVGCLRGDAQDGNARKQSAD